MHLKLGKNYPCRQQWAADLCTGYLKSLQHVDQPYKKGVLVKETGGGGKLAHFFPPARKLLFP